MDTRRFSLSPDIIPEVRPDPMTKAETYLEYLRAEGYSPRTDDDGDVVFKFEGKTYLLICAEADRIFFWLMRPAFWQIESAEEERRALSAVNQVNSSMKVIKLVVVHGHVWASTELYIEPFENFKQVFQRCLQLLALGVNDFSQAMFEDE